MPNTIAESLLANAAPLAGAGGLVRYVPLVWMGMPLVGVFAAEDNVYLTITSSVELNSSDLYFAVKFSKDTLIAFKSGRIGTLEEVMDIAGGKVLYSTDLVSFSPVDAVSMPEDDKVVFGNTWRDFEVMFTEDLPDLLNV